MAVAEEVENNREETQVNPTKPSSPGFPKAGSEELQRAIVREMLENETGLGVGKEDLE